MLAAMVDQPKRWALATGAVLTQINDDQRDRLGGRERTPSAVAYTVQQLDEWWDVKSSEDLQRTLHWLWTEGHRAEFERAAASGRSKLAFLAAHRAELEGKSLLAWDPGRPVAVAGWGFVARYLAEQEAWNWIMAAAQALQKTTALGRSWNGIIRSAWSSGAASRTTRPPMPSSNALAAAEPAAVVRCSSWRR